MNSTIFYKVRRVILKKDKVQHGLQKQKQNWKQKNRNKKIINQAFHSFYSVYRKLYTLFYLIDISEIEFYFALHYLTSALHFCDVIILAFFDVGVLF